MLCIDTSHVVKILYVNTSRKTWEQIACLEHNCQSQFFCQGVKMKVFHSMSTTKERQNLLTSFLCNKNILCKNFHLTYWHVLNLLLQKDCFIPLQPFTIFIYHIMKSFQVIKLWGLGEGLLTFRALSLSPGWSQRCWECSLTGGFQ